MELEDAIVQFMLKGFALWGTPPYEKTVLRPEVIDEIGKLSHEVQTALTPEMFEQDHSHLFSKMNAYMELVASAFMCYVKCFDETASDDAEDNYYMEREWRVLEHVGFKHDDVARVYVPDKTWANRFKEDHPAFAGHVMIAPSEPECVGLCCTSE